MVEIKSAYKRSKFIKASATAALIVVVVLILSSHPTPELGLQVENVTYDPSTRWFRVYETIEYEIPDNAEVTISLIEIKEIGQQICMHTHICIAVITTGVSAPLK